MDTFYFVVRVDAESREQAETVLTERLGFDEEYGFDYVLDWVPQEIPTAADIRSSIERG